MRGRDSRGLTSLWGLLNTIALLGLGLAGILATKHYRKLGGGQARSRSISSSYARRRKKSSKNSAAVGAAST